MLPIGTAHLSPWFWESELVPCLCLHLQTAGRRLQQTSTDQEATITVRNTFTGTTAPSLKLQQAARTPGCTGIRGLDVFIRGCQLQLAVVATDQVKQPGILLVQQPTLVGERLTFVATYTEDDQPVSKVQPIALTTQPPNALDCTNTQQGASQVFSCRPTLKLDSVVVIATGPNPNDPAQRVTASVAASNISELNREARPPGGPSECGFVF